MEKLRIGIVGCGGIANGKHLPALKNESDRVEMVAFCDLIPERAEQAAKEYGTPDAKTCTDYHESVSYTHLRYASRGSSPATVGLSLQRIASISRSNAIAQFLSHGQRPFFPHQSL